MKSVANGSAIQCLSPGATMKQFSDGLPKRRLLLAAVALSVLPACGDGEESAKVTARRSVGSLDLDIRDVASVELSALDDALSAKVRLSKGFGVAPQDAELVGKGRVESFPEADLVLYTAKLSVEPTAGGPCGSEPVSLALSLYRRGNAERVGGALTPYCGRDVWHGVPARAPLRITGKLPVPK